MFPSIFARTLTARPESYKESCHIVWRGFLRWFGLEARTATNNDRKKPSIVFPAIAAVVTTTIIFTGDGLVAVQAAEAEERHQATGAQLAESAAITPEETAETQQLSIPIVEELAESASFPGAAPVVANAPANTSLGIDVGSSQAGINLNTFADEGGGYAIVKEGGANIGGGTYVAPRYAQQVRAARDAGLPVGHYWFNGQNASIEEQAEFFIATALVEPGDIIALDIEDEPATGTRPFTPAEAERWISLVEEHFSGVNVLLYMNVPTIRQADWSALTDNPLWVAAFGKNDGSFGRNPYVAPWNDWTVWQYSSTVRVPGFGGAVDANIAKRDLFRNYGWNPNSAKKTEERATPIRDAA